MAKYWVSTGGLASAGCGSIVVALGWGMGAHHPVEVVGIGLMLVCVGMIALIAWWAVGRCKTLHDVYTLGYRQGRRDANAQLLEDGVWLSDVAEASAIKRLPPPA